MTEVAIRQGGNALAMTSADEFWSDKQIAALQQLGLDGASNADLAVFHHVCQRTGLDPFARQIYMIKRDGKQTIQTGIDGLRLVAHRAVERTGETLSITEPLWCGDDGTWRDVWLQDGPPAAARIVVRRGDGVFTAVALWREYVQHKRDGSVTAMWQQRPAGQLAKCAEALALRKAFPQDLSGVYTNDEIADDHDARPARAARVTPAEILGDAEPVAGEVVEEEASASSAQLAKLRALYIDCGWTDRADLLRATSAIVGRPIESSKELTKAEASTLIDELERLVAGDDPADALTELVAAATDVVDAELVEEAS